MLYFIAKGTKPWNRERRIKGVGNVHAGIPITSTIESYKLSMLRVAKCLYLQYPCAQLARCIFRCLSSSPSFSFTNSLGSLSTFWPLGDCTMPQKVRRRLVRASNLSLPVTLLLLCIWYGPYGDEAQRTTLSYILHFYFSITV